MAFLQKYFLAFEHMKGKGGGLLLTQNCPPTCPLSELCSPSCTTGHNSDGKFIARAQRIEYDCELVPRRVAIFIEKTKDGQILPVPNVVVRDVACGANHTVRSRCTFQWLQQSA